MCDYRTPGYRTLSLWHDTAGEDLAPRASLAASTETDVLIVGGGYTGLWTAYYIKKADPSVRVAIVEREICGYGASGRHGGSCGNHLATPREKTARRAGRQAAVDLQRAMSDTVTEVGRVVAAETIDCDFQKDGHLKFATNRAQALSLRRHLEWERSWGFGEEDCRWLDAHEATRRVAIDGALGASFVPHSARVHPLKLARGLARVVEGMGVSIFERTPALGRRGKVVRTPEGEVKADVVVRATESYTVTLPGQRRTFVPVYSLMICTEPLPGEIWERIGSRGAETWNDGRHLFMYACPTGDGRIAIGGRGAPYHFGSRVNESFAHDERVFRMLGDILGRLLPPVAGAQITHRWGGSLAMPRDWTASVGYDRRSGLAWAGGYIGSGVATSNLAGRTLRDLVLDVDSPLRRLPWVNHRERHWEPEPLRWLGVNLTIKMLQSADRAEIRTGRPARRAELMTRLIGG